ncbi:MAG: hypothetical protein SFV15_14705 [Polyangiaceae bacterium]|nr:hypothetical protein [Polyangiaceae bacterium]
MQYRFALVVLVGLGWVLACAGNSFEGVQGASGGQSSAAGGKDGGRASGGSAPAAGGSSNTSGGRANSGGSSNSGGAASGGGSSAGVGGSGSGGQNSSHGECATVQDCTLFSDCCSCAAVPSGELTPSCLLACIVSACTSQQVTEGDIACVAGRCVLNRSCDDRAVTCDAPTPQCDGGRVPEVANNCYTGRCLPPSECSSVSSCAVCTQANLRCAIQEGRPGNTFHCVETPPACQGNVSCGCMGVCQGLFQCPDPSAKALMCVCPAC